MATHRIDNLLTSGPIPPGPAFDIAIGVANRIVSAGNVGPIMLRVDRIQVSPDGSVTLMGQRMPGATAEGDAYALGMLLVHMIVGAPYSKEQHGASLREVIAALELWPGGKEAIAAVEWMLAIDPKSPSGVTPAAVLDRLKSVRAQLGGSPLTAWVNNLAGTPSGSAGDFGADPANPELATGMIPVGALAKLVNQGPPPSASAENTGDIAPAPAPADLPKSNAATPVPVSTESKSRMPSASLLVSGAVLWMITAALLFVALLLVVYLIAM